MGNEDAGDATDQPQVVAETIPEEHDPLDVWLRHRLHQSYDVTRSEQNLEELLRMLDGTDE